MSRALSAKPLVVIGDWSCSIYLWHWSPVVLAAGLMAAANTGLGGRFEAPGAAAETTIAEQNDGLPDARQKITRKTTRRELRSAHVVVAAGGCVNRDVDPVGCRFGPKDARGTLLMLGDSQAYAIADGVIDAASALG